MSAALAREDQKPCLHQFASRFVVVAGESPAFWFLTRLQVFQADREGQISVVRSPVLRREKEEGLTGTSAESKEFRVPEHSVLECDERRRRTLSCRSASSLAPATHPAGCAVPPDFFE